MDEMYLITVAMFIVAGFSLGADKLFLSFCAGALGVIFAILIFLLNLETRFKQIERNIETLWEK